jgi:hypothetical protein
MELDELRRLNVKLTSGCYPLLVTSDPEVMRGYDFRSQKVGMILCIAKSFARNKKPELIMHVSISLNFKRSDK